MRTRFKFIGFGFALLSFIAILWQHYGMIRILHIDRNWPHYYDAIDDSGVGGGSKSRLEITDDGLLVTCELTLDHQYAFCELALMFSDDPAGGLDLTQYDEMIVAVDYKHPGVDRMRIMIRNFNPEYSIPGDYNTLKVNEIDFRPSEHPVLRVPLNYFQVASWWRHQMNLHVRHIGPEFSSAVQIDLSTGGQVVAGTYSILLRYIEFRGKWIQAEPLYRSLLIGWLIFALVALLWELQQYRNRLLASYGREADLKSMNRLLELQSEKFARLASQDSLTGIRNRAGMRDIFLEHVRNARFHHIPLAAIFVDIDHFKVVNDTHGHQLGDQILAEFAQLLASNIRDDDLLARWGGEEFLLICPDTDLRAAHNLAQKLRCLVSAHQWVHGSRITASFGVTEYNQEDVAIFIGRADTALYEAKAKGRNRVVSFTAVNREINWETSDC